LNKKEISKNEGKIENMDKQNSSNSHPDIEIKKDRMLDTLIKDDSTEALAKAIKSLLRKDDKFN